MKVIDDADWKKLMAGVILPFYSEQLTSAGAMERFDAMAAATLKALQEDKWTPLQTQWCVKRVVRVYTRLDNLLAMLQRVNTGEKSRDGEYANGWEQSREYDAMKTAAHRLLDQNQCLRDIADGLRDCRPGPAYCKDCPKLTPDRKAAPTWMRDRAEPTFQKAGDVAKDVADRP